VKKETAMQNISSSEKVKEDNKTLGDKFRPIDVSKMSKYGGEREILFPPLSSFKIDSLPKKMKRDDDFEYYKIKLEYIATFISTKEILIMDAVNAFK
jgi:hypothetical protein